MQWEARRMWGAVARTRRIWVAVARKRRIWVAVAPAVAALVALLIASPAGAEITGPCSATINGENVAGRSTGATADAIEVEKDSRVPVSMSASTPISQLEVEIEFGGFAWTVHDEPTSGTSWSKDVDVDRYAKYGIGLYKVSGSSAGAGIACSGSALVLVKGNPLGTVAGGVGLGMAIVGALGLAGFAFLAARGSTWPVVAGPLLGLVAGIGLGVLFQQYGLLYPTRGVAIAWLAGGLGAGLGLPALLRLAARRR